MKFELRLIAPIPVGHPVTIHFLEERSESLLGQAKWSESDMHIVSDDETRIVYTGRFVPAKSLVHGAIDLGDGSYRIARRVRGRVTACALLTDHGDGIRKSTLLEIDEGPAGYR
jgi:hypothetical protein